MQWTTARKSELHFFSGSVHERGNFLNRPWTDQTKIIGQLVSKAPLYPQKTVSVSFWK
jgi:hypothetical protein